MVNNRLALLPQLFDFFGSHRFLQLKRIQLEIVNEVGEAVLEEDDAFEQQSDVELV